MLPSAETGQYGLRDSPFFRLRKRTRLCDLLKVSQEVLDELLKADALYERGWKHKKEKNVWLNKLPDAEVSHLYRAIDVPDRELKAIQLRISKLLGRVEPPDWLFSPVKGRSYVDNAARHRGSKAFWLLDIADYFPHCTANNVAHLFRSRLECSPDVAKILVRLTTLNGSLPQGSPCSPILAYFSNLEMWLSIARVVSDANLIHSVYADDISISGELVRAETVWKIKKIVHKHGHSIKREKEVSVIAWPVEITGVIVRDGRTALPNRQLQRLMTLRRQRHAAKDRLAREILDRQIAGRVAQKRQVEKT